MSGSTSTSSGRSLPPLRGTIPILVTPFAADNSVDLDDLDNELDFLVAAGVRWVGFGFGSESPRLGPEELERTMAHAVRKSGGRLGIIGNAEMPSARAGIESVRRVQRAGADLAMVRPSGLDGIDQEQLFEAISTVANEAGLPIVVQDAPQNTGVQLSPGLLARLLKEVPGVAAIKVEPPGPAPKMSKITAHLDGARGTIIGGSGGLDYLHELERGAIGTMPGPAFPEVFSTVQVLHEQGDRREAFNVFSRVLPLITLSNREMDTFLFVQKQILLRRGVLSGARLRWPHRAIDEHLAQEIDELLDIFDILKLLEHCRRGYEP